MQCLFGHIRFTVTLLEIYFLLYNILNIVKEHQERAYQEYVATKAVEKSQKQESYYEQLLSVNQTELSGQ